MQFLLHIGEVFYAPYAFYRRIKAGPESYTFIVFFTLLAMFSLALNLFSGLRVPSNFLQAVSLTLVFFAAGFIRSCIFTALINKEEPKATLKEVWLLNSITLYPVFLIIPLGAVIGRKSGLFLVILAGLLVFINILRHRMLARLFNIKPVFIWIVSISGLLVSFILLAAFGGISLLMLSSFFREMAAGLK